MHFSIGISLVFVSYFVRVCISDPSVNERFFTHVQESYQSSLYQLLEQRNTAVFSHVKSYINPHRDDKQKKSQEIKKKSSKLVNGILVQVDEDDIDGDVDVHDADMQIASEEDEKQKQKKELEEYMKHSSLNSLVQKFSFSEMEQKISYANVSSHTYT